MDEKIRYINSRSIYQFEGKDGNGSIEKLLVLFGLSYDSLYYLGVDPDTGEVLCESVADLSEERFDFGGLCRSSNSTIREARNRDLFCDIESNFGVSEHNLSKLVSSVGVSWDEIYRTVQSRAFRKMKSIL
jgi:hypothetical protein